MQMDISLTNVCERKGPVCINCSNHFMFLRPLIKGVSVSKHFVHDLKGDEDEMRGIILKVLDCSAEDFTELHKFEESLDGNMIFRAKSGKTHVVYCIDKEKRIIFLRSIKNFKEYKRLLEDKKELEKMLSARIDIVDRPKEDGQ